MNRVESAEFQVATFQRSLLPGDFGRALETHGQLSSTNDRAMEWARAGAPHGAVVLAEEQLRGRGRLGRVWHSARGQGIWASTVAVTGRPPAEQSQVPLVAGLALAEALAADFGVQDLALKWPNDVELNGRKLAGFLCERLPSEAGDRVIIGSGINVGPLAVPAELQAIAVSLAGAGCSIGREPLLAAYLGRLEARLGQWERSGFEALQADYLRFCDLPGRRIQLNLPGRAVSGTAVTVDASGALVLESGGNLTAHRAGEVERVR